MLNRTKSRYYDTSTHKLVYVESISSVAREHSIGLQDFYGHEIYPHDIIQTYNLDGTPFQTFYIKYLPIQCRYNISQDLITSRRAKVIGNIYENPDLVPAKYRSTIALLKDLK